MNWTRHCVISQFQWKKISLLHFQSWTLNNCYCSVESLSKHLHLIEQFHKLSWTELVCAFDINLFLNEMNCDVLFCLTSWDRRMRLTTYILYVTKYQLFFIVIADSDRVVEQARHIKINFHVIDRSHDLLRNSYLKFRFAHEFRCSNNNKAYQTMNSSQIYDIIADDVLIILLLHRISSILSCWIQDRTIFLILKHIVYSFLFRRRILL